MTNQMIRTEEYFKGIYNCSTDGIAVSSIDGILLDFNGAFRRLTGWSKGEVVNKKHYYDITPKKYHNANFRIIKSIIRTGHPAEYEKEYIRKDGSRVPVLITSFLIRGEDGQPIGIAGIIKDMTDRKKAEEALTSSENRYRALFNSADEGIFVRDIEGKVIIANEAMVDLTGYKTSELIGMHVRQLFTKSSLVYINKRQKILLKRKNLSEIDRDELQLTVKDGTVKIIEVTSNLLSDDSHHLVVQTIARDVTMRKRLHDNIRNYASLVIKTQEEERNRIARELHDETAQSLVSLGINIDSLSATREYPPEILAERLLELRNRTNDILLGVRDLSRNLRPPMLKELGLVAALKGLAKNLASQYNFENRFSIRGIQRRLPEDSELGLFRVVQEALNNVGKHAQATKTTLSINFRPESVRIRVADNGLGFELPETTGDFTKAGKLGLIGMLERLRILQGTLAVKTSPAKGTTLVIEIRQ